MIHDAVQAALQGASLPSPAKTDRFWFERPGDDLPFYDGRPVALSGARWLGVLAAVALGFAALLIPAPVLKTGLGAFVPAVLFFAIPLTTLALLAPRGWKALSRKVRFRDVLWMFAFALLNIVVTLLLGLMVMTLSGANGNPLFQTLPNMPGPDRTLFFGRTILQLFGEEVLTVLPFLAIMTLLYGRAGASRRWAMVGAWIVSAAMFGALHLPTYGWNWIQCLVIIGGARLVLTLPYIMTRNIWVSTGAHIINDWTLMGSVLLLSTFTALG
jgi:membrane protease YdiL (CAAX protease family)